MADTILSKLFSRQPKSLSFAQQQYMKVLESSLEEKAMDPPPVAFKDTSGNWFFTYYGSNLTIQNTLTMQGQANAYMFCPPVNYLINKKLLCLSNARWKFVDEDDNELLWTDKRVQPLGTLMRKPNPAYTWREFIINAYCYHQVQGQVFIMPVFPVGMNWKTRAIWTIPNWLIYENITGKIFSETEWDQIINEYNLMGVFGDQQSIKPDDMLRIRDVGAWMTSRPDRFLWGQSRLYPLSQPISNIMAAFEARHVLMTNRGAIGILSQEAGKGNAPALPLTPKEQDEVEKRFQSTHGLTRDKSQIVISKASLKWQAMTYPTKDLLLFEEIQDDVRVICEVLGIPFGLNAHDSRTNSLAGGSRDADLKSLYYDTIIPDAELLGESFCDFFHLSDNGIRLMPDYSRLPIFQKDSMQEARAMLFITQANSLAYHDQAITEEEYRTDMDLDPIKPAGTLFTAPVAPVAEPPKITGSLESSDNVNS